MKKISALLLMFFIAVDNMQGAHKSESKDLEINYDTLDYKYYPYIMFYGDSSDEAIAELIKNIDNGQSKSGLFLGVALGGMSDVTGGQSIRLSYGAKLGYQSFLPSFFERLSKPGMLGGRIYIEYHSVMNQKGLFGAEKFSNISLAYDLLLDLPVMSKWDAGIIVGLGVGSSVYGDEANSHASMLVNVGFGTSFLKHNRLDFELKVIPSLSFDWFGAIFTFGYNYVF